MLRLGSKHRNKMNRNRNSNASFAANRNRNQDNVSPSPCAAFSAFGTVHCWDNSIEPVCCICVMAMLRLRQLLGLQYWACVPCCICNIPNLRTAHAAFVTLSLGGLDGGSRCLSQKHLIKNIGVPYCFKSMLSPVWIGGGYIRPYTNPFVLQYVYPCRPYQIAGHTP